jgi:hypothetical protein
MGDCAAFQHHARDCIELAGITQDKIQASQLLKIADGWIKLAEQAEQREVNPQRA